MQNFRSLPAGEVVGVADRLQDFVEVLEHDQLALHAHLAPVDVLQQHARAASQLGLKPLALDDLPDLAEHDFVGAVQHLQHLVCLAGLLLVGWILLDVAQHLIDLRSKVPVQVLCFQPAQLAPVPFLPLPGAPAIFSLGCRVLLALRTYIPELPDLRLQAGVVDREGTVAARSPEARLAKPQQVQRANRLLCRLCLATGRLAGNVDQPLAVTGGPGHGCEDGHGLAHADSITFNNHQAPLGSNMHPAIY